jgi:hypothetical protein
MIEIKLRHTWLPLLLALAGCGAREPDPFGKLSKEQLAKWESDCSEKVSDTPTRHDIQDPEEVTVADRVAFASATRRLRCAPAGWTLWLEANDRIAGLCTESYVDVSVNPSQIATAAERGEPILRRHFPGSLVDEMVHGFCVSKPHPIGRRLLRWEFELPQPREHSRRACCWEVIR